MEQATCPGMIVPQVFRVTLQRMNKAVIGGPLHCFDQAVAGVGGGPQWCSEAAHRLMVEGVDRQAGSFTDTRQVAVRLDDDVVAALLRGDMLLALVVVSCGGQLAGDVLIQISAQRDVQHLHPATDGKDGYPVGDRPLHQLELHHVQIGHCRGAGVG